MLSAMSSNLAIRARGLTKIYDERSLFGTGLLGHIRGRAPKGGAPPGRAALSGIDLDVIKGEVVGVLGLNGAGKTTLLSILSGVLKPTSGSVERQGRLVPLLGVGTSFMPELSGRENAEFSLLMTGVPRRDARARLAAVEAFADIGHHFDAPTWTFSSGMVARVAFAAALQVQADTLVIDETLSVGDTAFREKCRVALEEIRKSGRTILLVTHAPTLITRMCTRAIVLDKGRKIFDGPPEDAVSAYQAVVSRLAKPTSRAKSLSVEESRLSEVSVSDVSFAIQEHGSAAGRYCVLRLKLTACQEVARPLISLTIRSPAGVVLAAMDWTAIAEGISLTPAIPATVEVIFDQRLLQGSYVCTITVADGKEGKTSLRLVGSTAARIDIHETSQTQSVGYVDLNMKLEYEGES